MIDESKYYLKYKCKESGDEYRGRVILRSDMELINTRTMVTQRLTVDIVHKKFRASKENKMAKNKPNHARPRMITKKINSREFREYLRGNYETSTSY
jgi:hypothetical protein